MAEIKELTQLDDAAWDALVHSSLQGNIFHRSDISQMLCDSDPRLKRLRLGVFDEGVLTAGQAMYYRVSMGVPMPVHNLFMFYLDSPLIWNGDDGEHKQRKRAHSAMRLLAEELEKRLGYVEFELAPGLTDMRPYQFLDWRATPIYANYWDLRDLDGVLKSMAERRKKSMHSAAKSARIQVEPSAAVMEEFLLLYWKQMSRYGLAYNSAWEKSFCQRIRWLEDHDLGMVVAARTPEGSLEAANVVILSPLQRTIFLYRQAVNFDSVIKGCVEANYWFIANRFREQYDRMEYGGGHTPSLALFKDSLGGGIDCCFHVQSIQGRKKVDRVNQLRCWKNRVLQKLHR